MSQELHYTSVPRGLKPGSRGFATVAATALLADTLASRLESLSGYQAVYPPGDPSAALNPIVHAHVRLTVAGKVLDVLSRIGPAGLDYSGRPNKYAHHIVLNDDDRPEGGPAWLLSEPGFLQAAWQGEPRLLSAGKTVPQGDRPASIAIAWQTLTGDAGWAGVLAESFLTDPRRPAFLVFRPGMEILPLFIEAIALLPAHRRWEVEFSTYFNTLPQGVSCAWRGVLDGSTEAKNARRLPNALIVDLCRPIGRASGDDLVHLARTGEHRERPAAGPHRPSHVEPIRVAYPTAGPPLPHAGATARGTRPNSQDSFDVLPDLAARLMSDLSLSDGEPQRRQPRRRTHLVASVVAACLLFLIIGFSWILSTQKRIGSEPTDAPSQGALAHTPEPDRQPPVAKGGADPLPPSPTYEGGARGGSSSKPDPTINRPTQAEDTAVATKAAPRPGPTTPPAIETAEKSTPPAPDAPGPREPLILACALPEIPKSQFGSQVSQQRALDLPEAVDDRFEILNASEFRPTRAASASTWKIATRTDSGIGGGVPLAQLSKLGDRSWQFGWTKEARNQSTQVEALRDAVLKFPARNGRAILVLLRGVETRDKRPITIVDRQPLLFERLDPRIRMVTWARNPEVLTGTKWRLGIRRWKVVMTSPDDRLLTREFESPTIPGEPNEATARMKIEQDLIPGEVELRLTLDPESPGTITVRVEPDRTRVLDGRTQRSARREALAKDTPNDDDGRVRDPIEYRRGKLAKLEAAEKKDDEGIQSTKREIAELEQIDRIRQTEDLLSKPVHAELSVVIGLELGNSMTLDIAKVGEFSD